MTDQFDYGLDFDPFVNEDPELDAKIDRWHDGALDCFNGKPKASTDPDYLSGWDYAVEAKQVRVVMPRRPEGYYHAALGSFD